MATKLFYTGPLVRDYPAALLAKIAGVLFCGVPFYNGPTWFLACLFSVSLIYYAVVRITIRPSGLLFFVVFLSAVGYLIVPLFDLMGTAGKVLKYFWSFPAAISACALYLTGNLLRKSIVMEALNSRYVVYIGLIVTGAVYFYIFDLNTTAFEDGWKVYYINKMNFGNYFLFYLNCFVGGAFFIFISKILEKSRILTFLGQQSLVLLGINGIFCHFINPTIVLYIDTYLRDISFPVYCVLLFVISAVEIAFCYPALAVVNKALRHINDMVATFYIKTGLLPVK